jgi:methylated-DNA-protein-cysteine methyltransferase-like protein
MPDSWYDRVYGLVRQIPPGRVMGYGHVAAALGHAHMARQVGWALAALPAGTDVPWQRVIRSSGHLALQGDPTRGILQAGLLRDEASRPRSAPSLPPARWWWWRST